MPTFLYIKQHTLTGLKYLGKTSSKNPYVYNGSGKYWKRHIKKYGTNNIKTLWVSEPFYNNSNLKEFALFLSEELDIVNSNEWANLKEENGLDGGGDWSHVKGKKQSQEHIQKLSAIRKGKSPWNKGKITPDSVKEKIKQSSLGRIPWNKGLIGSQCSKYKGIKQNTVICPHCNKTGGYQVMGRWHFDNCKLKEIS